MCWGWGPGKGSESEVTASHFLFPSHSTSSPGRAWIAQRPTALLAFAFPLAFVRSPPSAPPPKVGEEGPDSWMPLPLAQPSCPRPHLGPTGQGARMNTSGGGGCLPCSKLTVGPRHEIQGLAQ